MNVVEDYLLLKYKDKIFKFFQGGVIVNIAGRLVENFILEEYKPLNVEDRVVVDI
ncbi:hypothetical protein [Sulfolobus acidocaldarius]|uniref:Uncharacterized protein n=2 Tax=Sulfolobus acidocaldarius TaxID=2285 RepID=M1J4I0_9CREN|nr:hypothetical protein [Sulfolobus acidocaldarius]AGE71849.1 hypothetical protein SacN8_09450 [Sulfolobus acidocaldarius N8]AGE74121.1 hypothetical protein SacRon12I_09470 [Sulfolobus acidocaldarius Ron12/I]